MFDRSGLRRHWHLLCLALVLVSVFLLYGRSLSFPYIWDTRIFMEESHLLTMDRPLTEAFTHGYIYGQLGMQQQSFYYRPLVNLSFMVEKRLWGLDSRRQRLVNIVLFLGALVFLFAFLLRRGEGRGPTLAAVVLFGFSPIHVENVVWVVGRCDLLLFLFFTASLFFLERAIRRGSKADYTAALVCAGLALFSKETAVFFLPLFLWYEWQARGRICMGFHLANLGVAVVFFIVKNGILGIGNVHLLLSGTIGSYIRTGLATLGYYARVLFFPVGIGQFEFVATAFTPQNLTAAALLIVLTAAVVLAVRRDREIRLPLVFFLITLMPYMVLAFSTLGPFRLSARYMMLPLLGLIWIGVRLGAWLRPAFRFAVVGVLLLVIVPASLGALARYRSNQAFWEDAQRHHPDSSFVLLKLAEEASRQERPFVSRAYLARALDQPMSQTTANAITAMLANLAYERADLKGAREWLARISFALSPYQAFHVDRLRARIEASCGRIGPAEEILMNLITAFPDRPDAFHDLHRIYLGFDLRDRDRRLEDLYLERFGQRGPFVESSDPEGESTRDPIQRARFFATHMNHRSAAALLEALPVLTLDQKLMLVESVYRGGDADRGLRLAWEAFVHSGGDAATANRIGLFFLRTLRRIDEARSFFLRSLEIDADQPRIRGLLNRLVEMIGQLHPLDR